MSLRRLYQLDAIWGGWSCRIAGVTVRRSAASPSPSEWRRIAVAKYIGMGSLVLATPLLQLLRRCLPQAEIALVTAANLAGLARMVPVDKVFAWHVRSLGAALTTLPSFIAGLRRWRPDAFFDLEFFANASALIAWLSGAPVRVGFHHAQSPRGRLLTHYLPVTPRHTAELFAALAWAVGIPTDPLPVLFPPRYDFNRVSPAIRSLPQPFLVINPNAGELAPQRRWHPERFRALLRHLLSVFPSLHFVAIGSDSERAYVTSVLAELASHPRVHNLAGQLNLDELCFLLERAAALVTNDSGPMHLAAALGTPCVALFGPETPDHYGPPSGPHQVLYKRLPCSPCLTPFDGKQFPCPFEVRCLQSIGVDEVVAAVKKVLSAKGLAAAQP